MLVEVKLLAEILRELKEIRKDINLLKENKEKIIKIEESDKKNILYVLANTVNEKIFIGTRNTNMTVVELLEDIKKRSQGTNSLSKAIQSVGQDNIYIREVREIPQLDSYEKHKLIGQILRDLDKKSMVSYQNNYKNLE